MNLFVIGYIFQIPNSAQSRKEEELGKQSKNVKYLVQGALTFPQLLWPLYSSPVVWLGGLTLLFTRCSSEGRTTPRSFRWGSLLEAPVGKMTGLPGQRPERWVEGCSSRGWAGQRRSTGTGSRAAAGGLSPAETQSGLPLALSLSGYNYNVTCSKSLW